MLDPQFELLIPVIHLGICRTSIQQLGLQQPALPDDLLFLMGKGHRQMNLVIGLLEQQALANIMVRD